MVAIFSASHSFSVKQFCTVPYSTLITTFLLSFIKLLYSLLFAMDIPNTICCSQSNTTAPYELSFIHTILYFITQSYAVYASKSWNFLPRYMEVCQTLPPYKTALRILLFEYSLKLR